MALLSQSYATKRANELQALLEQCLEYLKSTHKRGMTLTWSVEGETGPQAILDQFGSEAVELFQQSARLVEFLKSLDPDFKPLPIPFEFTINADGTVTVGDRISVPAEEVAE